VKRGVDMVHRYPATRKSPVRSTILETVSPARNSLSLIKTQEVLEFNCSHCNKEFTLWGRALITARNNEADDLPVYCGYSCKAKHTRILQKQQHMTELTQKMQAADQTLFPGYYLYRQHVNTKYGTVQLVLYNYDTGHKIHTSLAKYTVQVSLGRLLGNVHVMHKDGDPANNELSNLYLREEKEKMKQERSVLSH
jgi:hypothetical protein